MPRKAKSKELIEHEATPLEAKPKRRRAVAKEGVESREPTPVAAVLEESPAVAAILASRDARVEIEPNQPMAEPSHAQMLGPRKRGVNEPGSIFTGTGFKLLRDADYYYFRFDEPPSEDRQRVMKQLLFAPEDESLKSWKSRDWAKATAYAQGAAVWMQGKDISHGRGA